MNTRHLLVLTGLGIGFAAVEQASAATVGLWLFDDLTDTNGAAVGGLTTSDSSPNNFDFVSTNDPDPFALNPSSVSLSSDRPSVIPTGTSLHSDRAPGYGFQTVSSSQFHRTSSGLTFEFWFKKDRITPSVAYIASYSAGNGDGTGAQYTGDWGVYYNSLHNDDIDRMWLFDYSSGFPEVAIEVPADNDWHHYAFTVDSTGNLRSYLDGGDGVGGPTAQNLGARAATPTASDELKLGSDVAGNFGDHAFFIDELRISDVALLPGNGTGNGELAWNASLVPEPSAVVGLALVAVPSILARRRRGA